LERIMSMRFIVLGDMHYNVPTGPGLKTSRDIFFGGLFEQIAARTPDLVFAIGDTTDTGIIAELNSQTALAQRFGINLVRLMGNHDSDTLEKSEIAPFFLGDHQPVNEDAVYACFDSDATRFIMLDTTRSRSPDNWSGVVPDSELAWLADRIEEYNRTTSLRHLVVMGHHPLTNTTDRSDIEWLNIDNSEEVRAIFNKLTRTPGLYINGHNHTNSLAGPDAYGWHYAQMGAPLACRSYGMFDIDENGIRFETVDIDLGDPEFNKAYVTTRISMGDVFNYYPFEVMYGGSNDHRMEIPASKPVS